MVELIVVMVLISMTTAFAVPNIRSALFTNQLKTASRGLTGLVTEIALEARTKRVAVQLRYDPGEHAFTTASESSFDDDTERPLSLRLDDSVEVTGIRSVHGGDQLSDSPVIHFSSRGYVDKTVIHLADDDGEEVSIFLSPFLGVSRVMEGQASLDDFTFSLSDN